MKRSVRIALLAFIGMLLTGSIIAGFIPAGEMNAQAFLHQLQAESFVYDHVLKDPFSSFLLSPSVWDVHIGDETLFLHEYHTPEAMEREALTISREGTVIRRNNMTMHLSWASSPFFFKDGRIIVLYVGEEAEILSFLFSVFGGPFAEA